MSTIAGIRHLDGRQIDPTDMRRMLAAMAHRSADVEGEWHGADVAFGNRLLFTTSESMLEQLPFEARREGVVIAADARIDNRSDLIAQLDLASRRKDEVTDAELIWRAYALWGESCPERLHGDFAFAIWDRRRQTLFCARDRFGVKPLYYHHRPGRLFAFASEVKGLLCLASISHRLNEQRLADYLQRSFHDLEATFYEDIHRLPPAHSITVRASGATRRQYWSLEPTREIRLRSNAEYAEAFRELFTDAVRCRLRSAFPVGSTLSGGLDSSSITCVARELLHAARRPPLHTFSLIYNEFPQCDEREFIGSVLQQGKVEPHLIVADRLTPFDDLSGLFEHEAEPSYAGNIYLHTAMYREAGLHGVRVLLDGMGGDSIVSHGFERLRDLAAANRWITFARCARGLSTTLEVRQVKLWRRYAVPNALRRLWRKARPAPAATTLDSVIDPAFAERTKVLERAQQSMRRVPISVSATRAAHYGGILAGINVYGHELCDRCAAVRGVEPRYPFYDTRLVEFCLALPGDQKLDREWTRVVLRRAMTSYLPATVCWRPGKTTMSEQFVFALLHLERQRLGELLNRNSDALASYVDRERLRRIVEASLVQPAWRNARMLWEPAMLAAWLARTPRFEDAHTEKGGTVVAVGCD